MENLIELQIQEILKLLDIEIKKIEIEKIENLRYKVNIISPDSSLLIGYNGTTLNALEHLLNILLKKARPEEEEGVRILLDIDNYRDRQEEGLLNLATRKAELVQKLGRPLILPPMSAYYRRLIHLHIAEKFTTVTTESIGEGERRQIVIKLNDENQN